MLHPVALKTSVGAYKNRKLLSKFLEQGGVGVWGKLQHPLSFQEHPRAGQCFGEAGMTRAQAH